MGGHGGLNILPQKKWNVYNHDNRAIVEKDKKLAVAKKREKYEKDRQLALENKLDVLKGQKGIITQKQVLKQEPLISTLNEEFKKLNQKSHINLFEREQKIIQNQQIIEIKRLQEAEFLKDKNMDYSSKFLGTYAQNSKKSPWYARQKGYVEQRKKPTQVEQLISVKKSDSHTINEVIKIESKHEKAAVWNKNMKEDNEMERSRQKKQVLRDQYTDKSDIEKLREKRLKRQQKERQKALMLKLLKRD